MRIIDVGKSSSRQLMEVNDMNNRTLFSYVLYKVNMDKATRKSAPYPVWWLAKYGHIKNTHKMQPYKPAKRPDNKHVFQHQFSIHPSYIDYNGHVSGAVNPDLCFETLHIGKSKGRFEDLPLSTSFVTSIDDFHVGEVFQGDTVEVSAWQCEGDRSIVNFELKKHGQDQVLYHCQMQFSSIASGLPIKVVGGVQLL
jgi:acyl-ACP thioesterase